MYKMHDPKWKFHGLKQSALKWTRFTIMCRRASRHGMMGMGANHTGVHDAVTLTQERKVKIMKRMTKKQAKKKKEYSSTR